jgi:hypothetical protein
MIYGCNESLGITPANCSPAEQTTLMGKILRITISKKKVRRGPE